MRPQRTPAEDPRYAAQSAPTNGQQGYPDPAAYVPPPPPYSQAPGPQDGYSYPPGAQPPALGPAQAAWPPAAEPAYPNGQPTGQPGYYPQQDAGGYNPQDYAPRTSPPQQAPSYAPQFDSYYAPQTAPPAAQPNNGYDPRYAAPAQPPVRQPQSFEQAPIYRQPQPVAQRDPGPDLRGGQYDHYAPNDPRGYDLGAYMAPQPQGLEPQFAQAQGRMEPPRGEPGRYEDEQWRGNQQGLQGGAAQLPATQQGDVQGYGDQHDPDADYEDEEVRAGGGRRTLMVVAALVGAIAIGGGLAYAYKSFMPSQRGAGDTKVVKAPQQPAKTQPADPGGRKIAGAESKLLDRLDGNTVESEPGAPKRVPILKINPDGSVSAPTTSAAAQPLQVTSVPGLVLVDGGTGPPAAALPGLPPARVPQPAANPDPVAVPRQQQAALAPTSATAPPQAIRPRVVSAPEPPAVAPAPPPATKAVPKTRPPATTAATTTAGGAAPAAAKSTSGGWVAVLATVRSPADALRSFADLQQKYGSALGNKIPDVREVDLSSKNLGVQHRLMVGPPGSREAANSVCSQLKEAGHPSCWITPY